MPYQSTSELPASVRDKYSGKCQRAFMHAFNSVYEDTKDDGKASAAGHAAAQRCEGKSMGEPLKADRKPDFRIFSGMLKAYRDEGVMRLSGIASSTVKDRHGDVMTDRALAAMLRNADNLTIFVNHDYKVPEDVVGSVEKAWISTSSEPDGMDIHDLHFQIAINDANPRAVQVFEAIDRGTKLGLSIGAMIPDGGAVRDKKSGGYVINDIDLVETSIVSIPANPRSWIDYAVKSLRKHEEQDGVVIEELEADALEHIEDGLTTEELEAVEEAVEAEAEDTEEDEAEVKAGEPEIIGEPEVDFVAAATNTTNDLTTSGNDLTTITTSPTETNATVSISTPYADINIDTGNRGSKPASDGSSQEAQASDPGTEETGAEKANPWEGLLPTKTEAIDEEDLDDALIRSTLRSSRDVIAALEEEVRKKDVEITRLQRDKDEAVAAAKTALRSTAMLLERMAKVPAGRRALLREVPSGSLEHLRGFFSDETIEIMKRTHA